jgi:site-specific recombinase XerD
MQDDIERFIQWVQVRSPQARTWRDYQCDLRLFLHVMGDRTMEDIRPRDVDEFVKVQIDRGYKPATVNRRLAAVASFYAFLLREGGLLTCPVFPNRHYLQEPQRLPRPVNDAELRKFFSVIRDPRDAAMFTLMLRCGLRIGEVSELRMADLLLGDSPPRIIIRGKGARERAVYLSPETERTLQRWLAMRPAVRDDHVILSYQHRKLSTTSINVRINHVRKLSSVDLTAHRLRHTFADNLLSAGMPITSIQKLMGHRFVETTQTYAMVNDKQVQTDFYKACNQLEGWNLLMGRTQAVESDMAGSEESEEQRSPASIDVSIPERVARLPAALVRQLEAYRRMKANRWRMERVEANSRLFFSQHGLLWEFFCNVCAVQDVTELRLAHVLQFVKARLDAGRSPRTVNGSMSSLRCFVSFLKEEGVQTHPSLDRSQRLKEPECLPRYISSDQMERLRSEIDANLRSANNRVARYDALLMRAVFYLLWQGGLRSGEVEMLRFSDVYVSNASLVKRVFVRDGKWRKGRVVYLTDVSLEALQAYLQLRGRSEAGGYVFMRNSLPLKKNFLCRQVKGIGRRVEVHVSPHRLRHTFATQLLNVGCKITSIQKLLGHASLDTTMTYARAFDQTVMLDYFSAIDELESQPGGAWHAIDLSA